MQAIGCIAMRACHTDNCQSDIGNRMAHKRAEWVKEQLIATGIESGRLNVTSLAANMGNEFVAMVNGFVERISARNG